MGVFWLMVVPDLEELLVNVQWCRSGCVVFPGFPRRSSGRQDMFVGEVVEVRQLDFCPCWARIVWSKFKVCVSVLTRMKLPMQRIRFGSSTRPSQMVLQWFVKNGVSSLSVL